MAKPGSWGTWAYIEDTKHISCWMCDKYDSLFDKCKIFNERPRKGQWIRCEHFYFIESYNHGKFWGELKRIRQEAQEIDRKQSERTALLVEKSLKKVKVSQKNVSKEGKNEESLSPFKEELLKLLVDTYTEEIQLVNDIAFLKVKGGVKSCSCGGKINYKDNIPLTVENGRFLYVTGKVCVECGKIYVLADEIAARIKEINPIF